MKRGLLILMGLALLAGGGALSCSSPIPNRNPMGESFPIVVGESLEGEEVRLPEAVAGEVAVLLVGYKQNAQFDIDRWLLGLLQAGVDARLYELPTIPGLVPTVISGWIDDGMRLGIPKEDWGAVVTFYGDAARPIAELTGTERGRNTRVLVLDQKGQVVWFADAGYSARLALELNAVVARLNAAGEAGS
ncbi:MAG: hypothetical protein CMJ94_00485 [Planctomycetes bacterium]|nr:hypothetical protein [Planctomycetota bacterium]